MPALITAYVRGTEVEADSDVPVPWWSFTKTVLASAALVLVAAGRLPLDERLRGERFTLRQVLQHRAGLPDYGALPAYHAAVASGEPPWPADAMLHRVHAGELVFEPGQGWAYSNVGYLTVRTLVERATDAPLGMALQRLVFGPIGVAGVALAQGPADLDGTAWGNARRYHPGWVYHGLLVGPAGAAAWFLHRLLAGDLLPPRLLVAMQAGHGVGGPISGRPWQTATYGLGLMMGRGLPPGEYVGHTGGGPGSSAAVYKCVAGGPQPGCTAAVFAPREDPGAAEAAAFALAHAAHGLAGRSSGIMLPSDQR